MTSLRQRVGHGDTFVEIHGRTTCVSRLVAQLREEVAAPFRTHVQEAPDRIDQVSGAVVLAGFLRHVEQLAPPKMANGAVSVFTEHIVHRLIPVFAGLVATLNTHRRPEFRRITEIVVRVIIARSRQQLQVAPAAFACQRLQSRDWRFGDDIGREALVSVKDAAVAAVDRVGAAGAGLVALRPVKLYSKMLG